MYAVCVGLCTARKTLHFFRSFTMGENFSRQKCRAYSKDSSFQDLLLKGQPQKLIFWGRNNFTNQLNGFLGAKPRQNVKFDTIAC